MYNWKATSIAKRLYKQRNALILKERPGFSFSSWDTLSESAQLYFETIARSIPVTLYGKGKQAHTGYNTEPYAIEQARLYINALDKKTAK